MRNLIFILTLLVSSKSLAVGWEEISKGNLAERGITVALNLDKRRGCTEIKIVFPKTLFFKDLGNRKFWSAEYRSISEKSVGWQISSQGTHIGLPYTAEAKNIIIDQLCLKNRDMKAAYISALYGGQPGSPPMIVIVKPTDHK